MSDLLAAAQEWQGLGDFDRAVEAYTRMIEAGEEGVEPLIRRAAVWTGQGRLAQAEADLERAVTLDPSAPWALLRLAGIHQSTGRPGAAATGLREAVRRTPWFGEVHVNAALSFLQLEWLDLARRSARELEPDVSGWWAGVRERSLSLHREQHAAVLAQLRARRTPGASPPALELALGLFRLGRLQAARRLCGQLMREEASGFAPVQLLARIVQREDGPGQAADVLRDAGALHGGDPAYRTALVLASHDAGRLDEVLTLLGERSPPGEGDALRNVRAVAALVLGREDDLRRFCRDWLAASPVNMAAAGFVTSAELRSSAAGAAILHGEADLAGVRLAQFWDSPAIPPDVLAVMDSWSEHHPTLARTVFDQHTARDYLLAEYGAELADVFDLCRHAAMKADLFRIAFLHRTGGVWADADELCVRPMGALLAHAAGTEATAPLSGDMPGYVHNFFMGAAPGGRLLGAALEQACAGVRRDVEQGRKPDIWMTTGPGLITRVIAAHLLEADGDGRSSGVTLLAAGQYNAFAHTEHGLTYKRDRANNWHLS